MSLVHIHQIGSDGINSGPLCSNRRGAGLKVFSYQVKKAVYSGADICSECTAFYESHRDYFDNLNPPWPPEEEAMAFGEQT